MNMVPTLFFASPLLGGTLIVTDISWNRGRKRMLQYREQRRSLMLMKLLGLHKFLKHVFSNVWMLIEKGLYGKIYRFVRFVGRVRLTNCFKLLKKSRGLGTKCRYNNDYVLKLSYWGPISDLCQPNDHSNMLQDTSILPSNTRPETLYPSGPSLENPLQRSIVGGYVIDNASCVAWGSRILGEPLNPDVNNRVVQSCPTRPSTRASTPVT